MAWPRSAARSWPARLVVSPTSFRRGTVVLACGLVVLANTRTFEGLVTALLVGLRCCREWCAHMVCALSSPESLLRRRWCLQAFAWVGYYNWRVTGHPLEMPYMRHEASYATISVLDGQPRGQRVYRHNVMYDCFVDDDVEGAAVREAKGPLLELFGSYRHKPETLIKTYARNAGLVLALAGLPFVLRRCGWDRWAVTVLVADVATICLESFMFPHYSAPLVPLGLLVPVLWLRELAACPLGHEVHRRGARGVAPGVW